MANYQYITKDNERWDNVAFSAYGDATLSELIIKANPGVKITEVLPPGITLNVPIIDGITIGMNSELLPPWKT